ncbi:hypothetical protein PP487_gp38 [Gordonia phage Herod]|uniref:Transcriptional regulator n=6 Tax=Nymphadoravirus TaxID=2169636 RepID=A0A142KAR4_9CAUD|nr:DNA helicase [Gordonia phage Nymphadora]YP_010652821.1 helix-turn-helix DNA-binding domain protein [Gordonia phage Bosnia]YP_010652903.1 hypothetical protein PP487_gp38 [Gordonia phage Herod]AOE43928.1 hypothetical protein SEA_BATSTARR_38 [Gordonia phage BatStarr]QDP43319.1 hypothetical protein SEA_EVIARTO_38 [Gordonia phage Eviarto]QDP43400.1 hypothetical protein SEA_TIMTAM_38 [Gordonia phage TimTam]AMS03197.1 hypothetical protein SEA_NYMPHADORA_38 [Gordonia phage Nymphadora]QOI66868.1 h
MTAKVVDLILAADAGDVGNMALAASEDQWFERKSIRIEAKTLSKALIAFANAEGGTVVIGVCNGQIEGIDAHPEHANSLRQSWIDFTQPPVRCTYKEVACINSDGLPDHLLMVHIETSERVHENVNGETFLRVGDESRKLNYLQRQELEFDKGQAQFDGMAATGAGIEDLDDRLVEHYRAAVEASSAETILKARSLVRRDGQLTNAGYLLFGETPQQMFPEAYVRVLRFLSTERGTGARLNLDEDGDAKFEGPIPWALQRAVDQIEKWVPKRRALDETGHFNAQPVVPREAWLEGLVNAVIHRSYSLAGDHIRVEIYPDRVEIESPGRFPGLVDPSNPLSISRFARNPRIARVCADLRLGQELGEGIKRIFDEMRRVGLTDPIYTQRSGSVRLRLEAVARLDAAVAKRLPKGSQAVLDVLRSTGTPLGTGEIAEATRSSRPAALKRLHALQNEGLIVWNGRSTRDPRATWKVAPLA